MDPNYAFNLSHLPLAEESLWAFSILLQFVMTPYTACTVRHTVNCAVMYTVATAQHGTWHIVWSLWKKRAARQLSAVAAD